MARRRRRRLRPGGDRGRLDRADLAAQHVRRPAQLQPARGPVLPRRPAAERLATGGIAGDGSRDQLIAPRRGGRPGGGPPRRPAAPGMAGRAARARERPRRAARRPPTSQPVRCPNCPSTRTRSCSAAAPTAWWTSARTCRRRTSSPRSVRATTRSSWPSATPPPRWAPPRASSKWSTRSRSRRRPPARRSPKPGTTTWRPPYAPVTLGALAGRPWEPVRYSPMQPWHEAHHARPLIAGAWIRPDHYGDPAAEVTAVRTKVGDHRRHPDRQARPARPGRAEAAQPAVRQQVVQAGDRPGPVRGDVHRGRRGLRRRRHRPARPRALPDEHHLVRRGGGLGVAGELAADHASRTGPSTSRR